MENVQPISLGICLDRFPQFHLTIGTAGFPLATNGVSVGVRLKGYRSTLSAGKHW